MPYGWRVNENGSVSVAPIEYYCDNCSFTTFIQTEEQQHYQTGHFTRSRCLDIEPYDEKKHGLMPPWIKEKVLKVTTI